MAQNPKVSIVLPTYNGASKYIKESIDSCLNQTYQNWELIVVDDCSKDETPTVVSSYKDPRIHYLRNSVNQRLPKSLNIGFAQATGEFVTWTSDDNLYAPTAIEEMLNFLIKNKENFVYCDIYAFNASDLKNATHEKLPESDHLKESNCVRACFLYSRAAMMKVGDYDPDMELIEDYDYWMRIAQHFNLCHIAKPLYYYRYHPQSLWCSRNDEIKVIEFLFKLKYDITSIAQINWLLRDLMSQKHKNLALFYKLFIKIRFNQRIHKLLEDFKNKKINFTQTRLELHSIING